jgi:Tfp pilus assembly protein PilN
MLDEARAEAERLEAKLVTAQLDAGLVPGLKAAIEHASRVTDAQRERIGQLESECERLRQSIEDVEGLHAQHQAENTVADGTYDYCDEEMAESRHQAATCALANAVWILRHSREEREQQRREAFERAGLEFKPTEGGEAK